MSELRSCAKRFGGLAFIYRALTTCLVVYIRKSDFHLINVVYVVIVVEKYTISRVFLRKIFGTRYGPVGTRFLWF